MIKKPLHVEMHRFITGRWYFTADDKRRYPTEAPQLCVSCLKKMPFSAHAVCNHCDGYIHQECMTFHEHHAYGLEVPCCLACEEID